MSDRYPGYDVLSKRDTPSWNEQTRAVVDARISLDPDAHAFFDDREWRTLRALCDRICPQPADRARPVAVAAMIDVQLADALGREFVERTFPPERRDRVLAMTQALVRAFERDLQTLDWMEPATRREAIAKNGTEIAGKVPELANRVQERILTLV